jgi:hypothetical protein
MVYVDKLEKTNRWRYNTYCHLTADSDSELLEFGRSIGLKDEWLQISNRGIKHFDIVSTKRLMAVNIGAVEL